MAGSFDMMTVPEAVNHAADAVADRNLRAGDLSGGGFALDDKTAGVGARHKTRIFEAIDRRMRAANGNRMGERLTRLMGRAMPSRNAVLA